MVKYKKYIYSWWKYILVIIIFIFLYLKNCSMPSIWESNGYACFTIIFSGIYPEGYRDIVYTLMTLFPTILIIYIFSDYMISDFAINYTYIFTRMEAKWRWLLRKTTRLFLEIALIYFILFLLSFLFSLGLGYRFEAISYEMLRMMSSLYILNTLTMLSILLVVNMLSLKTGSVSAFFIGTILYLSMLILSMVFYGDNFITEHITTLLPPSQHMYIWHSDVLVPNQCSFMVDNPIKGFLVTKSIVLLLIYIFITYFFSYQIIKKNDLSNIVGEDTL